MHARFPAGSGACQGEEGAALLTVPKTPRRGAGGPRDMWHISTFQTPAPTFGEPKAAPPGACGRRPSTSVLGAEQRQPPSNPFLRIRPNYEDEMTQKQNFHAPPHPPSHLWQKQNPRRGRLPWGALRPVRPSPGALAGSAFHVMPQLFQEWNLVGTIVQFQKKRNNADSRDFSPSQERVFMSG